MRAATPKHDTRHTRTSERRQPAACEGTPITRAAAPACRLALVFQCMYSPTSHPNPPLTPLMNQLPSLASANFVHAAHPPRLAAVNTLTPWRACACVCVCERLLAESDLLRRAHVGPARDARRRRRSCAHAKAAAAAHAVTHPLCALHSTCTTRAHSWRLRPRCCQSHHRRRPAPWRLARPMPVLWATSQTWSRWRLRGCPC